jgi:hypothetical protein
MTFTKGDFDGDGTVTIRDFNLLASNYGKSAPPRSESGTINLFGDTKYDIRIEFRNTEGPAALKLYWSSPSQEEELVPHERLYSGQLAQSTGTTSGVTTQSFTSTSETTTDTTSVVSGGRTTGSSRRTIGVNTFSTKTPIAPIDDSKGALALAGLV